VTGRSGPGRSIRPRPGTPHGVSVSRRRHRPRPPSGPPGRTGV